MRAHKNVVKSQSCMVISGRLIVHAPVQGWMHAEHPLTKYVTTHAHCHIQKGWEGLGTTSDDSVRVRFLIIGHARIENVGESQSCMVSTSPIVL
eukprot:COSAG05_NODE_275_length_12406_cov_12.621841_7_plen_94_part_00